MKFKVSIPLSHSVSGIRFKLLSFIIYLFHYIFAGLAGLLPSLLLWPSDSNITWILGNILNFSVFITLYIITNVFISLVLILITDIPIFYVVYKSEKRLLNDLKPIFDYVVNNLRYKHPVFNEDNSVIHSSMSSFYYLYCSLESNVERYEEKSLLSIDSKLGYSRLYFLFTAKNHFYEIFKDIVPEIKITYRDKKVKQILDYEM